MTTQLDASTGARKSVKRYATLVGAAVALAAVGTFGVVIGSNGHARSAAAATIPKPRALGNVEMSLSIPGVSGDGTPRSAQDIEIQSYSWGASNPEPKTSSGLGAGKVSFSSFSFQKKLDKTSPLLMQACASKTIYPTMTVYFDPSSGEAGDSVVITLSQARVVTDSQDGASGGGGGEESVSLNFTKITYNYLSASTKLVNHMGWDLKANKKA